MLWHRPIRLPEHRGRKNTVTEDRPDRRLLTTRPMAAAPVGSGWVKPCRPAITLTLADLLDSQTRPAFRHSLALLWYRPKGLPKHRGFRTAIQIHSKLSGRTMKRHIRDTNASLTQATLFNSSLFGTLRNGRRGTTTFTPRLPSPLSMVADTTSAGEIFWSARQPELSPGAVYLP